MRQNIIPEGMTVKAAAELIGIGRPALSNFLNGKSSLSPTLALRLKKAFDVDDVNLLKMQSEYDKKSAIKITEELAVRSFVPHFLTIKSHQIEKWVNEKIDARNLFPVLLRKLVHSTGLELAEVNFPGYDNSQRHGSDGFVESGVATPWIPKGKSFWEFGTDQNIKPKAESDYQARIKSIDHTERLNSTFIFVTPRKWNGLEKWVAEKNAKKEWKAVRAFDSNDLEQWLEQSVPVQIWLAEQLGVPHKGYETLDRYWERWASVCTPTLSPQLFKPSIQTHKDKFRDWLEAPEVSSLFISADSSEEALAFLSCIFEEQEFKKFKDITAIFSSSEELKSLIDSTIKFIPVVSNEEVERELFESTKSIKSIILRPRNAIGNDIDIKLDRLNYEDFERAVISMGIEKDVDRLAKESGRSITILRRRLAKNATIRTPKWATNDEIAKQLVPITLIGVWNTASKADCSIISKIAKQEYHIVEKEFAGLLGFDDSPVWSLQKYRGLHSKIDALFAIERMVTQVDIEEFFTAAEYILSEYDPALDLPEKDRWASALYDKTRNHSAALRQGVCETLVLLALNGNHLFYERLGINVEGKVVQLIQKLLSPLTLDKLLSQKENLPFYAEAAPEEFLNIIETDITSDDPTIYGLLKPVNPELFGVSPSRTNLLWALECLAWNPKTLPRVSRILSQLATIEIADNWGNKPIESLKAIFRAWMPQTAASNKERFLMLERISKQYPDIAWQIALDQIQTRFKSGFSSYRPNWRDDASGKGQVVTRQEFFDFQKQAFDFLVQWPTQSVKSLTDLLQSLYEIPLEKQSIVWQLIEDWSEHASELDKANLREEIRKFALTNRTSNKGRANELRDPAKQIYERLEPSDLVLRYAWLFKEHWVEESSADLESDIEYADRDVQIHELRFEAITQLLRTGGNYNVLRLIEMSKDSSVIGKYVCMGITDFESRKQFVRECFLLKNEFSFKYETCLQGFFSAIDDDWTRTAILAELMSELSEERQIRLFTLAPFNQATWNLLNTFPPSIIEEYWKSVVPYWSKHSASSVNEFVASLLNVQRPRAAFYTARIDFDSLETQLLKTLLESVVSIQSEPSNHYLLESYYVSKAFESLNKRPDVTKSEIAQLEFYFVRVLKETKYGIPNLEAEILHNPSLFVDIISYAFKRNDGKEDPSELKERTPEQKEVMGVAAYELLESLSKIPGMEKSGAINVALLNAWINDVREKCKMKGRLEIGDQLIGKVLSRYPQVENGTWPSREICEVMEDIRSSHIAKGFIMGVINSRGAFWYSGGKEERKISAKYRQMSETINFEYPYVASILEEIAKTYDFEATSHAYEEKIMNRLEN